MQYDIFEGAELYCVEQFVQIKSGGVAAHFFTTTTPIDNEEEENEEEKIPEDVVLFHGVDSVNLTDAIQHATVLAINDDHDSTLEHVL